METHKLNNLDRSRYKAMKMITISVILIYFSIVSINITTGIGNVNIYRMAFTVLCTLLLVTSTVMLTANMFNLTRIIKEINSDVSLKNILCDELYKSNLMKSYRNAFISFMSVISLCILATSLISSIPSSLICNILFVSVLSTASCSWLYYNRQQEINE